MKTPEGMSPFSGVENIEKLQKIYEEAGLPPMEAEELASLKDLKLNTKLSKSEQERHDRLFEKYQGLTKKD